MKSVGTAPAPDLTAGGDPGHEDRGRQLLRHPSGHVQREVRQGGGGVADIAGGIPWGTGCAHAVLEGTPPPDSPARLLQPGCLQLEVNAKQTFKQACCWDSIAMRKAA